MGQVRATTQRGKTAVAYYKVQRYYELRKYTPVTRRTVEVKALKDRLSADVLSIPLWISQLKTRPSDPWDKA